MTDIAKTKEEMEYALQTGWDRDAAIRHGLEAINQLEDIIANMWLKNKQEYDKKLKHAQSTAKMIAAVKQDIEKLEKVSSAEINKAKSIIEILCEVR